MANFFSCKQGVKFRLFPPFSGFPPFLGGLSLHLNHLIAEQLSAPYRQFGTLPTGIFLSNLGLRTA